jgi:hypothetical protein
VAERIEQELGEEREPRDFATVEAIAELYMPACAFIADGFKAHLPSEPRDRIYTHQIDKTKGSSLLPSKRWRCATPSSAQGFST